MKIEANIPMIKKVIAGFVSLILGRKIGLVWGKHAGMMQDGAIMLPPPTTGDASQIAALTRMAVHEAGHALHTDPLCMSRLTDEELLVFNLLEDPRMEMEQRKQFAGAGLILGRGMGDALDSILSALDLDTELGRSRVLQLDILLRGFQAVAPQDAIASRLERFQMLAATVVTAHQRVAIDCAIADLSTCKTSQDTEHLAMRLNALLREPPPSAQPEPPAEQDEEQTDERQQSEEESSEAAAPEGESTESDAPGSESGEPQELGSDEGDDDQTATESSDVAKDEAGRDDVKTDSQTQCDSTSPSDANEAQTQDGQAASTHEVGSQEGTSDAPGGDMVADSGPGGDPKAEAAGPGAQTSADAEQGEPARNGAAIGEQGKPTAPIEHFDLGDLLREAYEARYGKPVALEEQDGPDVADAVLMEQLQQAIDKSEVGNQDLDEMIEAALAVLQCAKADPDGSGKANGSPGAKALAAVPAIPGTLNVRLDGVQSQLVRVLLREFQDKRRRPMKYARAGGQFAVERFWRLSKVGDTKVFRAKARTSGVDVALKVLLDRSGSMKKTLQTAAETALAFSLAMQRVGNVTTSVSMFPGVTTVTETLQEFGQSAQSVIRRCSAIQADGGTPLGAAVTTELPKLLQQRKEKHVLIVITDDGPDDATLLSRALDEAARNDVVVIGVGIGCDIRTYIPNSTTISCIQQLPDALEALFREELTLRLAA